MDAGPWLPVPPGGYGGIENVVATLVPELRARGHRVVLATVGESTLDADGYVRTFHTGRFRDLSAPYNVVSGLAHAHLQQVVRALRDPGTIETAPHARPVEAVDLVHDHVEVVGPAVLAAMGAGAPPVLQTLHWDLRKHPEFYAGFDGGGRVHFAGVSRSQVDRAPANLRAHTVGVVPLATPLPAYDPDRPRGDFLLGLGRLTPVKGYDTAARLCRDLGLPLVLAGPVGGQHDAAALRAALEDPASPVRGYPDVSYFLEEVEPLLDGETVRWVGSVAGAEKDALLAAARAVLFPIRWEEPGGTAVIEALSAGTPVVGMARGCLPSLVEHGVTGWLADTEEELAGYLTRVDELDPVACRRQAEERFAPPVMARQYEELYVEVLRRSPVGAAARRSS